ncbi:MAG: hypothetical protein IPO92_20550 [Saprospiraceae bacterium]|nr:hypothetical protein [Saprospiraceae bacterium]
MQHCNLELHPQKTKIVNLRGESLGIYPKKYDFLGFQLANWCQDEERC